MLIILSLRMIQPQLPCPALYLDEHLAISVAAGGFTAPLWLSAGGAPPVAAYPVFVLRLHRSRHRLWQKRELQLSATAARPPRQCYRRGLGGVRASGLGCGESDTQCDSESDSSLIKVVFQA